MGDLVRQSGDMAIYAMGGSFILGSLFTVFLLLMLDFIRRNKETQSKK